MDRSRVPILDPNHHLYASILGTIWRIAENAPFLEPNHTAGVALKRVEKPLRTDGRTDGRRHARTDGHELEERK